MFSSNECALPSGAITMTCGGIIASACSIAVNPSLVTVACHSLPVDFTASRAGLAVPSTGTVQT
jgi:hypothetical protein